MIAPTLLVGLGGTGSKIICRVANKVTKEQRQHLGFAVFDTDIKTKKEEKESSLDILNECEGKITVVKAEIRLFTAFRLQLNCRSVSI